MTTTPPLTMLSKEQIDSERDHLNDALGKYPGASVRIKALCDQAALSLELEGRVKELEKYADNLDAIATGQVKRAERYESTLATRTAELAEARLEKDEAYRQCNHLVASPDLLDALKLALKLISHPDFQAQARAAIAKATK